MGNPVWMPLQGPAPSRSSAVSSHWWSNWCWYPRQLSEVSTVVQYFFFISLIQLVFTEPTLCQEACHPWDKQWIRRTQGISPGKSSQLFHSLDCSPDESQGSTLLLGSLWLQNLYFWGCEGQAVHSLEWPGIGHVTQILAFYHLGSGPVWDA